MLIKSQIHGSIKSLTTESSDPTFLGVIGICEHDQIWQGMCVSCGATIQSQNESKQKYQAYTAISNEIQVSQQFAKKQGKSMQKKLIDDQKLILILDLDNTVIHAVQVQRKFDIKKAFGQEEANSKEIFSLPMRTENYIIKVR